MIQQQSHSIIQGELPHMARLGENMRSELEEIKVQAILHSRQTKASFSQIIDFNRIHVEKFHLTNVAILQSLSTIKNSQENIARMSDSSRMTLAEIKDVVEHITTSRQRQGMISAPGYQKGLPYNENTLFRQTKNFIQKTLYLQYLEWNLPIGTLQARLDSFLIDLNKITKPSKYSLRNKQTVRFRLTYMAPLWLSSAIIELYYKAQSQHNLTNWGRNLSISLQKYNLDPNLRRCLDNFDVDGLQQMFNEGIAGANDYLPNGWPLLYVSLTLYLAWHFRSLISLYLSTR